jgi:predicted transposase/invertase (TIGR01784 family)
LNIQLNDKIIKKFFNAKAYKQENDVAIKSFLKYIISRETSDDFTHKIEAFIKDIKSKEANKKEYSSVNIHDQDIYFKAKNEGIAQGISQGEYQAKIETAKKMLKNNISLEIIVECTGLSVQTIKNL